MILFLVLFVLWAVVHSLTAAIGLKRIFRGRFGEKAYAGWYRLLYNVISVITFLPIYLLIPVIMPQTILWEWSRPYITLAYVMQIIGLIGLLYSLWVTNVWDFLGIRQVNWYLKGGKGSAPETAFTTKGPYALVRHPLYFFSLLLLWFNPIMTIGSFVFYLVATVYFYIGSYYEEKKLAAGFGNDYRAYQQRVPRLIPFLRKPN